MALVKAFNLIPRRIVWFILQQLGVPTTATQCWFQSLKGLTQVLQIGKELGPPMQSTTGLPEGDSMSVVGMLALSFAFHHTIASPQLRPFAYADNLSFMTTSERAAFGAIQKILNFITALRMQIDFTKSWAWATSKQFREFWRHASALLMQTDFQFQIKNNVYDLGCMIHYSNAVVLGPIQDKMDNAVAKCNRLRKLNLDLDDRAEKVQVAIWPAVFYGALGQVIGEKHFETLRRAAAKF